MEQGAPVDMRWIPIFTLIVVFLWSPPGISAKVARFTDKEGTLHISNEAPAEPGKPGGVQAPAPIGTPPPQKFPSPTPRAPVPPPQVNATSDGAPGSVWQPSPTAGSGERRGGSTGPRRPSRSSRTGAAGMIFPVNRSRRPDPKDHDLWIFILPV